MNLARSSLKLFAANVARAVIQFLGIVYFARLLGAAPLGIFFLFQALLGLLSIPADFGLRGAVEKRISEGTAQGRYLSSAIALKIIPISVIVVGVLLLGPYVNEYVGASIAAPLALAIVLQEGAKLSMAVLKGELRVGEIAALRLSRELSWVGLGTVFVSMGFDVNGLVYGLLVGLGLVMLWGWYKCSTPVGRPSVEHARSLFDYGKYNAVSSIGGYFYSWMDVAIIGLFLTQADVGAYEVAWRVTALVVLLSTAIAESVFPQVSEWDEQGAAERIEETLEAAFVPSMLLVIPSFFGVIVLSQEILGLIFGQEFTTAGLALIVLMGEKLFQSVHKLMGKALQGIDRPDLAAYATVISVAVNVLLNVVLVLEYGIVGAAVATLLSFGLNTVLHWYYLSRFVTVKFPWHEIGWLLLSSVGMTAGLLGLRTVVAVNTIPRLVALIFGGALAFGALVFSHGTIRRGVLRQVRSIFPARSLLR